MYLQLVRSIAATHQLIHVRWVYEGLEQINVHKRELFNSYQSCPPKKHTWMDGKDKILHKCSHMHITDFHTQVKALL
jgi:hypothetical protein